MRNFNTNNLINFLIKLMSINLRELIIKMDDFVKKFRFCPRDVQERVNEIIRKHQASIDTSSRIIQLLPIRNLIDELSTEIENCVVAPVPEPTPNIFERGWTPPESYSVETEREDVLNIKRAYDNLNRVIRGEKNLLSNKDLITLLNFIIYKDSRYWKRNLSDLIREYRISGRRFRERKKSLSNRIYDLLFGKGLKITVGEDAGKFKESPRKYYFSIDRRNRVVTDRFGRNKFELLQDQLDIADDMGFSETVESVERRIKELKYYLKYLVYKNKYLELRSKF